MERQADLSPLAFVGSKVSIIIMLFYYQGVMCGWFAGAVILISVSRELAFVIGNVSFLATKISCTPPTDLSI